MRSVRKIQVLPTDFSVVTSDIVMCGCQEAASVSIGRYCVSCQVRSAPIAQSLAILVAVKNKFAESMYPMGIER